jgi:hypothetical protein
MEELIRQLPHDNKQLEDQWSAIFDKLHKLSIDVSEVDQPAFKVKCLAALTDYVMADDEEVVQIKLSLIDTTIGKLSNEPLPPLDELVSIFCRLIDVPTTNKLLNLKLSQKMYHQYRLGERLCTQGCVKSIDRILLCLQKHEFCNTDVEAKLQEQWKQFLSRGLFSPLTSDTNKLNRAETMLSMRPNFQQLYR